MSQREVLLVLAHAQQCERCRTRMLEEPDRILIGRALSQDESAMLGKLAAEDFLTPQTLAKAAGVPASSIAEYSNHPIVRLRHF